jgi:hypothetical protein
VALADPAEETFLVIRGDASDPAAIAGASRATTDGAYPALHDGELLLVPMRDLWQRGVLRTLQSPVTDPVSFALLEGVRAARFPIVRGWSARDLAARAISEHLPRLVQPPQDPFAAVMLALTAARAALLAETIAAGEPELALTPLDVAGRLADRSGEAGTVAGDAEAWLREGRGSERPAQALARDLLTGVRALPAYKAVREGGPPLRTRLAPREG